VLGPPTQVNDHSYSLLAVAGPKMRASPAQSAENLRLAWEGAERTQQVPVPSRLTGRWCLGFPSHPRKLLMAALVAAALIAGCGEDSGDSAPAGTTGPETPNQQAEREYEICKRKADRIADTQGANAGIKHLEQCTDQYARDLQVEP
jgi:hypothetical protein